MGWVIVAFSLFFNVITSLGVGNGVIHAYPKDTNDILIDGFSIVTFAIGYGIVAISYLFEPK